VPRELLRTTNVGIARGENTDIIRQLERILCGNEPEFT
jgi:hypothetical protein